MSRAMSCGDEDELLDVVDKNDTVIGQEFRFKLYKERSSSFRVINVLLTNKGGQVWIPRRTAGKRLFPLCLDVSVGGHVRSGESYEEAMRREVAEEINLDIDRVDWKILGKLTPDDHAVSAFMRVYEIRMDTTPPYNRDDFVEYHWLHPRQVLEMMRAGEKAKDDLVKVLMVFYGDG